MSAQLIEAQSKVLEDTPESLLPDAELQEGEQFASLEEEEKKEELAEQPKAKEAPKAKEPPAADAEDDVPEELKGKTPAQLAKMYRDAHTLIGRQGHELAEFRKKADLLIQASLAQLQQKKKEEPAAEKKPELDETDFFAKPKEAIQRAIEEHPLVKELAAKFGNVEKEKAIERATANTQRFNQAHPDAAQIMQDPEFRAWVQASSVRMGLLQRAHTRFDFDAGDEVFGTWKALKAVKKAPEASDEEKAADAARVLAARRQKLKDAKTPTGGNAAPAAGNPGAKKIYRRADVLKLMEENPDRYEQLAPEIEMAYREGRVR